MNRIIHFEIYASEPERIAKFYQEIFGWEINEVKIEGVEIAPENRYWLVGTAPEGSAEPGINGGIAPRRGPKPQADQPANAFVCTINVPDIDEFTKKIESKGGKVVTPKMPIKGMAWIAYFTDIEGNNFSIFQEDKNAA